MHCIVKTSCVVLTEASKEVRLRSTKRILEFRESSDNNNIGVFVKPRLNFNANEYFDMISKIIYGIWLMTYGIWFMAHGLWLESILKHIYTSCFGENLNSITMPILCFP